jgi:hypothetical protein
VIESELFQQSGFSPGGVEVEGHLRSERKGTGGERKRAWDKGIGGELLVL